MQCMVGSIDVILLMAFPRYQFNVHFLSLCVCFCVRPVYFVIGISSHFMSLSLFVSTSFSPF